MSVPSPNVAVYTEDLVLTPAAHTSLKAWVDTLSPGPTRDMLERDLGNALAEGEVAAAGFDTIIVGLWHVHGTGDIYYNDFPINSNTTGPITESIKALKSSSRSTVETVVLSFGGGNWYDHPRSVSDDDYPNMKANWSTFKPALCDLLKESNANGVDWDYEPEETPFDTDFIIQITNELSTKEHYWITAAPFKNLSDWQTVIGGTFNPFAPFGGGNNFSWWNLQTYGHADYGTWVTGLESMRTGLSSDRIQAFLVPGFSISNCGDSPADEIRTLRSEYKHLDGAFIWNYTGLKGCAVEMASSIRKVFAP